MLKPWDKLRDKPRIKSGRWRSEHNAVIDVRILTASVEIEIGSSTKGYAFMPEDLRQLAEFCTELADQMEGK